MIRGNLRYRPAASAQTLPGYAREGAIAQREQRDPASTGHSTDHVADQQPWSAGAEESEPDLGGRFSPTPCVTLARAIRPKALRRIAQYDSA